MLPPRGRVHMADPGELQHLPRISTIPAARPFQTDSGELLARKLAQLAYLRGIARCI